MCVCVCVRAEVLRGIACQCRVGRHTLSWRLWSGCGQPAGVYFFFFTRWLVFFFSFFFLRVLVAEGVAFGAFVFELFAYRVRPVMSLVLFCARILPDGGSRDKAVARPLPLCGSVTPRCRVFRCVCPLAG